MSKSITFLAIKLLILGNFGIIASYDSLPDLKITGGENTTIADYPYMLALTYLGTMMCGAALISPTWVLTSAICTDRFTSPDQPQIFANSSLLNTGIVFNVSRIVQHPDFDHQTLDSDISLLELSEPATCQNCKPISLATQVPQVGQNGSILGWGWTVQLGNDSDVLQVLKHVPIEDHRECEYNYLPSIGLTENMFCAGYMDNSTTGFCGGDNGGPFVVDGKLAGLASWTWGCGLPDYSGVYTAVANFRDWINDNVNDTIVFS